MDDVSQQLATLSPEQRAWLELRLKRKGLELPKAQTIPKRKDSNALPLSFAQQRLWFIQQLDSQNASYNIPVVLRLQGHLRVAVLQQTFYELVSRHETLRTRIMTDEQGQPVQIIDSIQVIMPIVDLSQISQPDLEIQRLATESAQHPFDLAQPLLRSTLLHLSETDHVLLLTMHHIISDRWSLSVLMRELKVLYEAFSKGENSPLPGLPIQYADWAIWQRQSLQGEVLQQQLDYWKQQLADLPVLEFPTDRPRPAVPTFRGKQCSFVLSRSLTTALKQLSAQEGVTLFVVLLTAFKVLLHQYTHQNDILVGTDIANRNRVETEGLIGLLVNTLVLRTKLAGNPTFRELLQRVREGTLGAYAHQDLPFEKLVEVLNPERSLSHMPLYQIGFDFQQAPVPSLEISDVIIDPLLIDNGTVKIDLRLNLWENEQRLAGRIEYSTDLFDTATITGILEHFQTLLGNIVTNPDNCLSELSILPENQRQKLLFDWNNTRSHYHVNGTVHQLFETQVQQTPDAIALVYEDQQLTYQELNNRANQLAHYLRSLGVQPEVFVGVCLERSIEMVIALFAILKAGGAYVPLDPTYPQSRLTHILADTQLAIVLTHSSLLTSLPPSSADPLCLNTHWETIAQYPATNLTCTSTADNLAYLIYTSGSTGTPKGVMVSQRSFINHTEAARAHYDLKAGDRILQFASINFDAAAEELFPGLVQGSTIVLRTDAMMSASLTFWQTCDRLGLTVLDLPTAFWHHLVAHLVTHLDNPQAPLPSALRLIIIGGESVLPERLATWQQQFSQQVRLVNSYGPTETTVVATICNVSQPNTAQLERQKVPIGKPIQNVQAYILNKNLQPVPIGVPGELYIGGVGVARGYLHQAALTAERFLPNPYSLEAGARFYKTGDWVRYRADGQIEFLGRLDDQVKIRGFRVELGEIEATLRQHAAVQDVVVLARQDEADYQRLVAYIVPDRPSQPTDQLSTSVEPMELVPNLRNFLQEQLPSYMVPSAFVILDELPLTSSGKVDRKGLPAPEHTRSSFDQATPPRTPVEAKLAAIWAEVLRLEQVGVHDNFFALGGDSILSIQIIAKANQAGLQLVPKQIFQHQTIAELATVAHLAASIDAEQGVVVGSVPLTPIQAWFFEQRLPDPHHFNQAVLLKALQVLNIHVLEQSLQQLLHHHDALRLRFHFKDSGWEQRIVSPDNTTPLIQLDLSALTESEQRLAMETAAAQLQASLNLSTGLLRFALFQLGAQPQRLLIVIHHLVIDGVSWRILLEELQTCYQQLSQGRTAKLPAKTTSFKAWSQHLQTYAQSAITQSDREYWLSRACSSVARLPVDFARVNLTEINTVGSVRSLSVTLSTTETQMLLQQVPEAYHTRINEVLLTALGQTLARWTGGQSILIDLEGHGREDLFETVDVSRTVGWFTTLYPCTFTLNPNSDLGALLKSVKEQVRSIPKRGIDYGILRYLSADPDTVHPMRSLPSAEIVFNYLGQFDQTLMDSKLFTWIQESIGSAYSPAGKRSHLIEVNGMITDGQLHLQWNYSTAIHHRTTIEHLAHNCLTTLKDLITHCRSPEAGGYTPSDFPLAHMGQDELDELLAEIE